MGKADKQYFHFYYRQIWIDIEQIDYDHFIFSIKNQLSYKSPKIPTIDNMDHCISDSFFISRKNFNHVISLVKAFQFSDLRKKVQFCEGWDDLQYKWFIKGFFLSYYTEDEYFQFEKDESSPPLIDYSDEIYPTVAEFLQDIMGFYIALKKNNGVIE